MCLTVSRRSRDLRPLSRDHSVTFFKKISNCLKRPKNVVWQSADGRVTSVHCRVTIQWLFSKKFQIAWNVRKTLFDSRPTVAWPPTTVTWPFSDFFLKNFKLLETSKKRCLTVGRRSRDLRPLSRDRSVTFFKKISNCLKRPKNVVWQSADGRVTSDHCRVTVQWLFSKKFQIALNVQKRCLTVGRRSRDLRPLSRDRWATAPHTLAYVVFLVYNWFCLHVGQGGESQMTDLYTDNSGVYRSLPEFTGVFRLMPSEAFTLGSSRWQLSGCQRMRGLVVGLLIFLPSLIGLLTPCQSIAYTSISSRFSIVWVVQGSC